MIRQRVYEKLNYIYAFVFLAVFVAFTFTKYGGNVFLSIVTRLISLCLLVAVCLLMHKLKRVNSVNIKKIFLVCSAVMLVTQIVILLTVTFKPLTDANHIDIIVRNYLSNGSGDLYSGLDGQHQHYLARYSNQWGIFIILSGFYKLVNYFVGHVPSSVPAILNIIALQASFFFMFKTACLIFEKKKQVLFCIVAMFINPILYGYTCYVYTDTLSMPFVIASVYLILKAFKSEKLKPFVLYTVASATAIGIGYSIKGSAVIILVAAVMHAFFKLPLKKFAIVTVIMISVFMLINSCVYATMKGLNVVSEDEIEQYSFPATHWVMMGLRDKGGYNDDDFFLTYVQHGVDGKTEMNVELIKARIEYFGVAGTLEHVAEKLNYTWGGGRYLLSFIYSESSGIAKYVFCDSAIFGVYSNFLQFTLVLFLLLSCIKACIRKETGFLTFMRLCAVGIAVFLVIWEARSRYLISFMPLLLIIAVDGFDVLSELCEKAGNFLKTKHNKNTATDC